ncbi:MAG: PepSY domain-containing protein, partial [Acidobacteriia bacterium]|nr:PepSY domain-containing protein [Terriglobia bacterium]
MGRPVILIRKFAILCHRWMGVAFCVLFFFWFFSGIFMMYWDFPTVTQADRLERSPSIDASKLRISVREAWAKLGLDRPAAGVRLEMFDARPVYNFNSGAEGRRGGRSDRGHRDGADRARVYADDGTMQQKYSAEVLLRIAAGWTRQPPGSARVEQVTKPDQWTVQAPLRTLRPLWKYSFPDGEQVYVSGSGDVVQYTTTGSRLGAYLGAIPHWLYFTPLRVQQKLWANVVIWTSGIGTVIALLGLIVGVMMYSPSAKYSFKGVRTTIPYKGQKRLHMILGLFFGLVTCTWAFSGMLSMDPPFLSDRRSPQGGREGANRDNTAARIQAALRPDEFDMSAYDAKSPQQALLEAGSSSVKELDFTSFDGLPFIWHLQVRVRQQSF